MLDTAPFVAHGESVDGCLTRLSTAALLNVTAGGGSTCRRSWWRSEIMKPPSLTLGIEEEYQIIDPETRELRSYITEILDGDHMVLGEIKPELHQSMVEVGTKVCRTPAEVRAELVRLRGHVMELAGQERAGDRRGRHPPVLVLDHAGDHARSSATWACGRTWPTWPSSC